MGYSPPPKKKRKIENEVSQSGCITAFPGMFNHDINYTLLCVTILCVK